MNTVPEKLGQGFGPVYEMSDTHFGSLVDVIDKLFETSVVSELPPLIRNATQLSRTDTHTLLDAIIGLHTLIEESANSLDDICESIIGIAQADDDEEKIGRFANRVRQLATNDALRLFYKSVAISLEHDRVFLDARIVSDIRPVFRTTIEQGIHGALIAHSLRIDSHHGGSNHSYYVTLTSGDLKTLKEIIERAISKEEPLNQLLDSADVTRIALEA